jgi:hypothetical protein
VRLGFGYGCLMEVVEGGGMEAFRIVLMLARGSR